MKNSITLSEIFSQNTFPTEYNPDDWIGLNSSTNCYAYALNCPVGEELKKNFYYVGAISDFSYSKKRYSVKEFLEALRADIKTLGKTLFESSLEEVIPEGFQKICVFLRIHKDRDRDFHFMRQDRDGYWSQKKGWSSDSFPTNCTPCGEKIKDPSEGDLGYYKLIGYYRF